MGFGRFESVDGRHFQDGGLKPDSVGDVEDVICFRSNRAQSGGHQPFSICWPLSMVVIVDSYGDRHTGHTTSSVTVDGTLFQMMTDAECLKAYSAKL